MIEVKQISKTFKKNMQSFYALKEISFILERGSTCGLIGLNGAGKTTLLRLLSGIFQCTDGEISYDELSITDFKRQNPYQIAYLSNDTQVYQRLTIREYLQFFSRIRQVPKNLFEQKLLYYSQRLKIENELNTLLENTSTGTRQKAAFLSVIMNHPTYLFLDEPFANIDILIAEEMLSILKQLKAEGTAIMISSHNLYEIESISDQILLLEEGNIRLNCQMEDLQNRFPQQSLKEIILHLMNEQKADDQDECNLANSV